MKWTGLTGGIASGKSTAKKLIEGLGFPVIDADAVSHWLTQTDNPGYQKILSHFGPGGLNAAILNEDRSLNRKKLGEIIFSDIAQRAALENILHPLIQHEVQKQKEIYRAQGISLCFYDVPLLFEKNLVAQFDTTVLVWCNPALQLLRLMTRNNLTESEARLRIKSQMSLVEKVRLADHCLDNSGEVSDLEKQIKKLLEKLI
ncbi:MAG: dephospho-CoA kinase [Pseudobdellovibrio sp.]